jgi:hypothetical protein
VAKGPSALKQAASKPLLEGSLFVARNGSAQESATWERFFFTHHSDGSLSFRPLKESGKASTCGSISEAARRASCEEIFLDADWRQPFLAAPWTPLSHSGVAENYPDKVVQPLLEDGSVAELFPFMLSYAPARPKPGDSELGKARRLTVVLAASTARARSRWLGTFSRKAQSPELRGCTSGPSSFSSFSFTTAPNRRVAALGEEHFGLSKTSGPFRTNSSSSRLPAGPAGMWDSHSSLCIVRDLYDAYAADPLSQKSRRQQEAGDSDGSTAVSTPRTQKPKFLERYVDRQAEIEKLLEEKSTGPQSSAEMLVTSACVEALVEAPRVVIAPVEPQDDVKAREVASTDLAALFPPRFALADKTSNVSLDDHLLSNVEWSGGAIFMPPDERSFRLTIRALDNLEENPVFIGLAPHNADLSMVSFFSSGGGMFLCLGGRPSGSLLSSLGAPAGPAYFHAGHRLPARFRSPSATETVSMHYTEGDDCGHVRFLIHAADGTELRSDTPLFKVALGKGPWRPSVLLCMPGTRVRVVRLI